MVKGKNTKMKKENIKPYMYKYVVKPQYVVDVKSWVDEKPDDAMIEMKGRSYPQLMYFKSLQKSNVLKMNLNMKLKLNI